LASVNEIFPSSKKPIIAGFGNRETDSIAYLRIQIPQDRIFCITEKSVITNYNEKDFQTTYPEMLDRIDNFFPLLSTKSSEASHLERSLSKEPLPTDENEEEILKNHRKLSHSEFY
jgi:phosphatidate phosphatase PAH1